MDEEIKDTQAAEETAAESTTSAAPEETPKRKKMDPAVRKKLRYGSIATAITCVVVAIVVVVNLLVSGLMKKYPVKLDLTENGVYEISQESIDFLNTLDKEVNFTVLMPESSFQTSGASMKMVSEVLERYTQYTDKIHLSYVDPSSNPDVVNSYQEYYSGTLQTGDIVVSDAKDPSKLRVVNINSLFTIDQQKYYYYYNTGVGSADDYITGFSGEQNLTSALMYVTDADPMKVGIIATGNSEPLYNVEYHDFSMMALSNALTKNGYDVETLDLYTDQLDPAVYDVLILPAPVNDVTDSAIEKLSAFLHNDGSYDRHLIYFADVTQSATPNLEEFLESWGIQVGNSSLVESDTDAAQQVTLQMNQQGMAIGVPAAAPTAHIDDTTYAAGLSNTSLPIVAPFCRPLTLLWESSTSGVTASLLKSSDSVYLNPMTSASETPEGSDADEETEPTTEVDKTPAGEQIVAAASKRGTTIDNVEHASQLMVLGSVMLTDYTLMQDASYNNSQYLISAINAMTGKGTGLIISEKSLTNQTLNITVNDMRGSMVAVFAVPLIVMIVGFTVNLRRRNK